MKNNPSLREFAEQLFDYAGLFPPASLDLNEAVATYLSNQKHDSSWMMGSFILPVSKWDEFLTLIESDDFAQQSIALTLILPPVNSLNDLHSIRVQLEEVQSALKSTPNLSVKALEWKWIPELDIKDIVRSGILGSVFDSIPWYIEWVSPSESYDVETWTRCLAGLILDTERTFGYKLRCGGTKASLVPSVKKVKRTIQACSRFQIPIKLTAGLHQPVRHYSSEIEDWNYGFFNVGGAILWANYFGLPDAAIEQLLLENEFSSFNFKEEEIIWKKLALPAIELPELKKRLFHGIGSCSFSEPVEALQSAGVLQGEFQEMK